MSFDGDADLDTILDRLIADPDKLDDVRDVLLRKLNETREKTRSRPIIRRAVADDEDYFDNVPV
ncbi:MAG: hypothetical protein AAGA08_11260 [Pseudomonadota bacterium]